MPGRRGSNTPAAVSQLNQLVNRASHRLLVRGLRVVRTARGHSRTAPCWGANKPSRISLVTTRQAGFWILVKSQVSS